MPCVGPNLVNFVGKYLIALLETEIPTVGNKKRSKTDKIGYFASFQSFFKVKKGVKCYPISILRPDLEPSHQGACLRHQNERKVKTLFS